MSLHRTDSRGAPARALQPQPRLDEPAQDEPPAVRIHTPGSRWGELIRANDLARLELSAVPDEDARTVAELCLAHADSHADAVKWLLFMNANVRQEVLALLQPSGGVSDARSQRALALRFLEAGSRLPMHGLAAPANEVVHQRDDWSQQYWQGNYVKHCTNGRGNRSQRVKEWPSAKPNPDKPVPFFHNNPLYSRINENGKSDFWCAERSLAAMGTAEHTKAFLKERDLDGLDPATLRARYRKTYRKPTIIFSRRNFGMLMQYLSLDMKPGERRQFPVAYIPRKKGDSGHAMTAFLEKDRDSGHMKVAFYEPNVTWDMTHLKDYPEYLDAWSLDDFDALRVCRRDGAEAMVLVVEPEPAALAKLAAGRFVARDVPSQLASAACALKYGNTWELDSAMTYLRSVQPRLEDADVQALVVSFEHAVDTGHAGAVENFLVGLKALGPSASRMIFEGILGAFAPPSASTVPLVARALFGRDEPERSFPRMAIRARSGECLAALAKFVSVSVSEGLLDRASAKTLWKALRSATGRRRWYLAGIRTNFASTNQLKKEHRAAFDAFKAAMAALKRVGSAA